jgi:hypothetical protein
MLKFALRVPDAEGVRVTLMVQFEPAPTLDPQLLVWLKSLGLTPEIAILVMLNDELPGLVSVTVWALLVTSTDWFANAKLAGETAAPGA